MPIVNVDAMRQSFFRDAGAKYHELVFYPSPQIGSSRSPRQTRPRITLFNLNTQAGPVVLEIPPATGAVLFGSLNDAWQVPALDFGPAGEDQGKGGQYLLLPPGYVKPVPAG